MGKPSVSNLPVWAQKEIKSLRAINEHLTQFIGRFPQSNTTCGIEALDTKKDLPHESRVQFHEERNGHRYIEAHISQDDHHLYLVGTGPLIIVPCVDNAFRVRLG